MKPNLQDPYCQFKSDWLRLLALCYRETLRKASRGAWGALIAASFIAGLDLPRPVWPQLVAHTPPPTPHKETAKALRGDSVAIGHLDDLRHEGVGMRRDCQEQHKPDYPSGVGTHWSHPTSRGDRLRPEKFMDELINRPNTPQNETKRNNHVFGEAGASSFAAEITLSRKKDSHAYST
jgi:hypothetical protein